MNGSIFSLRFRECGEDLLVDLSEILFNELAFFLLMQDLDNPRARIHADMRTRFNNATPQDPTPHTTSAESDDELTSSSSSEERERVVMETDDVKLESVRRYNGNGGYQSDDEGAADEDDDEVDDDVTVSESEEESRNADDEEMEKFDNVSKSLPCSTLAFALFLFYFRRLYTYLLCLFCRIATTNWRRTVSTQTKTTTKPTPPTHNNTVTSLLINSRFLSRRVRRSR